MPLNRYRIPKLIKNELIEYPTPSNINYFWSFGSLAGFCLIVQILTGVFLAMNYIPQTDLAFESVERIMRDVDFGWLFRYLHSNGASLFFFVVYIHIARGLFFLSFFPPKGWVWFSGLFVYLLMMATAFLGYVLPWGQMSYWAATVITNIITSLPFGDGGEQFSNWLWGDFSVANATLNRFYSFHYVLPFVISGVILVHLYCLHIYGSTEPLFRTKEVDFVKFYPYFYLKDFLGFSTLLIVLLFLVWKDPNYFGHSDNYIPANPLVTPKHIVPEWYFLPFYGILRSIKNKFIGIAAMYAAIILLVILPLIPVFVSFVFRTYFSFNCSYYGFYFQGHRRLYNLLTIVFIAVFIYMGWFGAQPVNRLYILLGVHVASLYFWHFIFITCLFFYDHYKFFLLREKIRIRTELLDAPIDYII